MKLPKPSKNVNGNYAISKLYVKIFSSNADDIFVGLLYLDQGYSNF